ncbi:MAG: ATP-binding protein, partial [Clostridiales bacterium]|jgi:DNA replication protein DnaC|nr:ATP-binding protein [Clostridiales bacterium]
MSYRQIVNDILRDYEKDRHFAELKREEELSLAMQNEEFRALRQRYNALVISSAYANTADGMRIAEECRKIEDEQRALLKKLKIGDPLSERFSCKVCRDTGYKDGALCTCVKKKAAAALKASASAPPLSVTFKDSDFSRFDESVKPAVLKLYTAVERYVAAFPSKSYPNILICGKPGTGKTFLTSCICNGVTERGFYAEYMTAFSLNNLFLACHLAPLEEKNAILDSVILPDLLVVDDLGTEPILKNVTIEYLFNVINERMLRKKCTVISTNLSPDQLRKKYDDRIFSRLCDKNTSLLLQFSGKDLRFKTS